MQKETNYITKEDVFDVFRRIEIFHSRANGKNLFAQFLRQIVEQIKKLPAADVRPVVRGKWKFEIGDGKTCVDGWVCTNCNCGFHTNVPYFEEFNFCPNCGAEMRNTAALEDAAQDAECGAMAPAT